MPESQSTVLENRDNGPVEESQPDAVSRSADNNGAPDKSNRSVWHFLLSPFRQFRLMRRIATPVTTRLTREGWQFSFMIGFVILGAVVRNVNLLVILAGTMLGFLLIQWRVSARSIYGISARRKLPRNMQARKPFDVEVIVVNPKRFLGAWWVVVEERITPQTHLSLVSGSAQTIGLLFPSVPPQSMRVQRYQCRAPKRGEYQLLGMDITTRFPLGLMKGILPPTGADSIIVQPALGKLLPGWTDLFETKRSGARHRQAKSVSDEGEFFGLRSYRPGDSPRLIHWRSSARLGELMVKQFQRTETREYVILLDLPPRPRKQNGSSEKTSGASDVNDHHDEDVAVEFVATIAQHVCASNHAVLTVTIADQSETLALRVQTRTQTHALHERLGTAKSGPESTLAKALQLLEREVRHVDHLLVVSTRPQPESFTSRDGLGDAPGSMNIDKSSEQVPIVFWRHMMWIDVSNKELAPYFQPAP
ncbi:MAG: DUF58 domain-containing protein [Pirellula sp.]|jgi:uncharacterized protein (DUF58 family)|nr:DUF58 domain-containing protein [Pirellula sp.]